MDGGGQGRRHRSQIVARFQDDELVMPVNPPVGLMGLGLMGSALSERLINAGVPVIGFDIEAIRRPSSAPGGLR
jgi:phosphoglycerate dehydrogenase-like enzyme